MGKEDVGRDSSIKIISLTAFNNIEEKTDFIFKIYFETIPQTMLVQFEPRMMHITVLWMRTPCQWPR